MGVALGFLPCGLLYAALASSAASGSAILGGLGMLAFGLGTVPALVVVGLSGHLLARRWRSGMTLGAPAVMLVNATVLLVLAIRGLAQAL